MKKNQRPSLQNIADRAGVSIATVSAVINNRTGSSIRVGEATRARIQNVLADLGYAPNTAAQVLAGGRSRIIAVFTYEPVFPFEHHSFYYPFLLGMEREAEQQRYDLLFMTSCSDDEGRRSIYRNGVNRLRLADAAILLGLRKNSEEISRLLSESFPVVMIGHREFPGHEASYVAADYETATAEIVERIVARGHRRIAMIRILEDSEPGTDRESGYKLGCRRAGIADADTGIIRTTPERITRAFVDSILEEGYTAVVCERFALAHAIRSILMDSGRNVPADLSVAALGGPRNGTPTQPANWMTLRVPSQDMGKEAIRLVLALMEQPDRAPLRTTLSCPIVEGETVREHGGLERV